MKTIAAAIVALLFVSPAFAAEDVIPEAIEIVPEPEPVIPCYELPGDACKGEPGKDYDKGALNSGLATVSALHIPHINPQKRFGVSLSSGFYEDKAAFGLGTALRFSETWQIGASIATDTSGDNLAGKAALIGQW